MKIAILLCLSLTSCMYDGRRWEWRAVDVEVRCPGGRVEQEKRITDVVLGRTRNTTIKTNTCLD